MHCKVNRITNFGNVISSFKYLFSTDNNDNNTNNNSNKKNNNNNNGNFINFIYLYTLYTIKGNILATCYVTTGRLNALLHFLYIK